MPASGAGLNGFFALMCDWRNTLYVKVHRCSCISQDIPKGITSARLAKQCLYTFTNSLLDIHFEI